MVPTLGVARPGMEVARSGTESACGAADEVKRWSTGKKRSVVLRLLRGEPVDAVSREVGVPIARLESWREMALAGMDAGLKESGTAILLKPGSVRPCAALAS